MSFMMVAQFKAGALIMKLSWPGTGALALAEDGAGGVDRAYYVGLVVFTVIVVGYTALGGFLAAVWTDLLQSVLMLVGVLVLLPLAVSAAGGMEQATLAAVRHTGERFAWGPGYAADGRAFHPLGLAISYFFVFIFSGMGSPASMVRIMACKDAAAIRRSIVVLGVYNTLIYLPLVVICIAARAVLPHLPASDEVIPRLAVGTTRRFWGGSLLAGLILAAPFGAVMATVSAFLVVIASGVVRDVYQRFLRPDAPPQALRRLAYLVMIAVGAIAIAANIHPVAYLQAIVVFSSTSAAATFVVPALMAAFWRRSTAAGALAAMLAGAATMLVLFASGWVLAWHGYDPMIGPATRFRPYYLLGLDPILWGLPASAAAGILVSLATAPPEPDLVARLFDETARARAKETRP
jgi:SSS family solute:Na+ symporter/sodium/pantothenate symporter